MIFLTLTAELNGVTDLKPLDDPENPFYYTFMVQCTSCREVHPNWVSVSRFEASEVSGSRGEANFVWKCKNCTREHSATIKSPPTPYKQAQPPKRQKIIEIDCRGLEFTDFKPDGLWMARSTENKTEFTSIEITDGEWYDYDEKAGEEVSIKECVWEIRRAA